METQQSLATRYRDIRCQTLALVDGLSAEDLLVQSMPDASPAKWHLAHTTWFFDRFVLTEATGTADSAQRDFLWNSYYDSVGDRHPRPMRGLMSRPSIDEVLGYRRTVDERMETLLSTELTADVRHRVEVGLHHEQQHQELILTDLKHAFASQPLRPGWARPRPRGTARAVPLSWVPFEGGILEIGHAGSDFSFDNERPRHRTVVERFELASRLTTAGEYLEFIRDRGYQRPEFWLSEGWRQVIESRWTAPLYWEATGDGFQVMCASGVTPLNVDEPVTHVSFYEADAFARWSGARLSTEAEWEVAAESAPLEGAFLESGHFGATGATTELLTQLFGELWQWTASAYLAYPGFRPESGALGEYNGKFMSNQMVLRGGSFATPRSHFRRSYRNFFPPHARWQFTGIRLARDV